ncbi:Hypothetical predicted protein, partial [Pelobates cultripes]
RINCVLPSTCTINSMYQQHHDPKHALSHLTMSGIGFLVKLPCKKKRERSGSSNAVRELFGAYRVRQMATAPAPARMAHNPQHLRQTVKPKKAPQ